MSRHYYLVTTFSARLSPNSACSICCGFFQPARHGMSCRYVSAMLQSFVFKQSEPVIISEGTGSIFIKLSHRMFI